MILRLARHSAWLFLARVATHAGMAIYTILLARQLGNERFGEYAFIAALLVIGNMITTFGTDMFLIREIAANDDLSSIPAAFGIQLLLSSFFTAGIILSSQFFTFQSQEGISAAQIYAFALFPLAFFTVCTTALRGKQQMGVYTILNLTQASTQVVLVLIQVSIGGNLITLSWLLLGSQFVAAALAGIMCGAYIPGFWSGWKLSLRRLLALAQASSLMALLSSVGILYQRSTLTILPFLVGTTQTGIFAASARLVEMAKIGHIAVFTAIYPMMARNRNQNSNWLSSYRRLWLILIAASIVAAFSLSLLTPLMVEWLFGAEYTPAVPVLQILVWILVPYTINNFLILAYLADRREKTITGVLALSLIGLSFLTFWWGQNTGALGAAWAAVVGELIQCGILTCLAMKWHGWLDLTRIDHRGGVNEFSNLP